MKYRCLRILFLFLFISSIIQGASAQNDSLKRQISIQLHGSAMMYVFGGVNVEMHTWEKSKSITGISLGLGYWDNGLEIPVHFYTLWKKNSVHHPEFDYGVNLLVIPGDRVIPIPTLSFGYRYQNFSKRGLVLRGGLNLGVMPYLGIGYVF